MAKSEWKIEWSDSLSVGVPQMDEEHRQFIVLANDLNQAVLACEDKVAVEFRMNQMLNQVAVHFSHEEALFDRLKFPLAAVHRVQHAELKAKFDRVMNEFKDSDISYVWALKGLQLKQLLIEHLLQEDMKYRDFVRSGNLDEKKPVA